MRGEGAFSPFATLKKTYKGNVHRGNCAVVTQLGECVTEDHEVAGSSPAHGTISYFSTI